MPEEYRPIHNQPIGQLPANDLRHLKAGCAEAIGEICHAIANEPDIVAAIRQLMQTEDTASGIELLRQSNPALAKRIVTAALGVLVNSINLVGIQDELQRRAREAN